MASAHVKEFTDANFDQEVVQSEVPVLVDFWAEWCQPCKTLGPTINELADDYAGKVKVGKLDIDSNQQTAMKYGIMAIPTVLVFSKGAVVKKIVGLQVKGAFVEALNSAGSAA